MAVSWGRLGNIRRTRIFYGFFPEVCGAGAKQIPAHYAGVKSLLLHIIPAVLKYPQLREQSFS
jgi:hypothetical protein